MAIYRCSIKVATVGSGRAAYDYICREGKYKNVRGKEDCIHSESKNLPSWTHGSGRIFWKEEEKKLDGYRKIELALPNELSNEENIELVKEFCEERFGNEYSYSYAVHDTNGSLSGERNIHCHIMFSERKRDLSRTEPSREDYFRKSRTRKDGSISGGYKKDSFIVGSNRKQWLVETRKMWENALNKRLRINGIQMVSAKSLAEQGIDRPAIDLSMKDVQTYVRLKKITEDMEIYLALKEGIQANKEISEINRELHAVVNQSWPILIEAYKEKKRRSGMEPFEFNENDRIGEYRASNEQLEKELGYLKAFHEADIENRRRIALEYYLYLKSLKSVSEKRLAQLELLATDSELKGLNELRDAGRMISKRIKTNKLSR